MCGLYPQVSELCTCPGEYPTTTDILITELSNDTAIQNINDVMLMEGSKNCTLTTVDNIILQSDMKYTIQVSFSNLDGEFNITTSVNFSEFSNFYAIVISPHINYTSNNSIFILI